MPVKSIVDLAKTMNFILFFKHWLIGVEQGLDGLPPWARSSSWCLSLELLHQCVLLWLPEILHQCASRTQGINTGTLPLLKIGLSNHCWRLKLVVGKKRGGAEPPRFSNCTNATKGFNAAPTAATGRHPALKKPHSPNLTCGVKWVWHLYRYFNTSQTLVVYRKHLSTTSPH